jgi:two-component system, sensor histidine kinase
LKNILQISYRAILLQILLFTLSYLSFQLSSVTNSLLLYLPLVLGIVFIHWFGWKIFPIILINGVTTLMIWGVTKFTVLMLVLSTHEAVVALVSWVLCTKLFTNRQTLLLGNTNAFLRFVLFGILIPVSVNSVYVYHYGFVKGDLDEVLLYWLSDFITILPVSMVLLYFFTYSKSKKIIEWRKYRIGITKKAMAELGLISLFFVLLSLLFPFDKYWFIYGIGATLFALRWGFEASIVLNVIIFLLSYLLPLFDFASSLLITQGSTQFANVHLGMSTMIFLSLLVGRVVSDLSAAEESLKGEKSRVEAVNNELQQANEELDRFVYSVSHDLSAPLKSIKGLVTISKMEPHISNQYLDKIDKSVDRLENFIGEVLDYSRTNRKQLVYETIRLEEFLEEINKKFEYLENFSKIQFTHYLHTPEITSDRFLLRVALSNLMSNAIKYQKKLSDQEPFVKFSTHRKDDFIVIDIADNGEGIKEEYKKKLFTMFYRGTATSSGSGLGLYIAKEAIQKMGGTITLDSTWGEGAVFRITLPVIKQ